MTTKDELKLWKTVKKILQKEINTKHGINEMDIGCPECEAAILIAFINHRIDSIEFLKKENI